MKLYKYKPVINSYHSVKFQEKNWNLYTEIIGIDSMPDWKPVRVTKDTLNGTPGDFPSLDSAIPVFTKKSLNILLEHIKAEVVVLPIYTLTEELYIIKVINNIDCLDEKNSLMTGIDGSNIITTIYWHCFKKNVEEMVENSFIFIMPQTKHLEVVVTEKFKNLVESEGLKGLDFSEPIYPSKPGSNVPTRQQIKEMEEQIRKMH